MRELIGLPPLSTRASILDEKTRAMGRHAIIDRDGCSRLNVSSRVHVEKDIYIVTGYEVIVCVFRLVQSQSQAGTPSTHAGEHDSKRRALKAGAFHYL